MKSTKWASNKAKHYVEKIPCSQGKVDNDFDACLMGCSIDDDNPLNDRSHCHYLNNAFLQHDLFTAQLSLCTTLNCDYSMTGNEQCINHYMNKSKHDAMSRGELNLYCFDCMSDFDSPYHNEGGD